MSENILQDNEQETHDNPADIQALKDQVKEFRNNNITLANQLKGYETNFTALQERLEAVEGEKKVVEEKAKGKETLEERLAALEESNRLKDQEIQRERTVNKQNRIKGELVKSLTDHGAEPAAANDAADLHLNQWDLTDEGLIMKNNEKVVYSQQNPGNPLTPQEWATNLRETKPYYFPGSKGDGARQGGLTVNGKASVDINDSVALGKITAQQLERGEIILTDNGVPV